MEYYQLAADQGNADAQNNLGYSYSSGEGVEQDYEKAVEYYQLAADQGNADAQYNLGYSYYFGEGVEQDYEKAVEYYQLTADQEVPAAMFALGDCYYLGNGVDQDLKKAEEWYQKALDAGYEPDETDQEHLIDVLGEGYDLNEAGKKAYEEGDYEKAFEYWTQAADLGNIRSLNNLGVLYENGYGVEQDYEKALEYFQLAADQ